MPKYAREYDLRLSGDFALCVSLVSLELESHVFTCIAYVVKIQPFRQTVLYYGCTTAAVQELWAH
jgi:hypothetical protein